MKVVVAGAGIGGLVTALQLHHRGIGCVVYERGDHLRELGVGINLLPHAVAELAALGLLDELDRIAVRTEELIYAHRLGPEILRRPCGLAAGLDQPQFSVHRGRLRGMLLRAVRDRLGPHAVRTGCPVTGFTQSNHTVAVTLSDGRAARCDALVAADGIHSTVRHLLYPDEGPPRWNGITMWRGATDWPGFGTGRSVLIAGGTPAKFVAYPIAPDSALTNWAVCVATGRDGDPPPMRQDWSRQADPARVRGALRRFRTPLVDHTALVAATAEVFEFPMCDRDPLPRWTFGRVTLLGDAAHPMFPMGSNGAGQAILDATALAESLAGHADVAEALVAYEDERLPVTADIVQRNRTGGPEGVIDLVEQRAPDGFERLSDVADPAELDAIVTGYTQASRRLSR